MTKEKKIAVCIIVLILLILDLRYSRSDSFMWLLLSAVFLGLYEKRKKLWALIPCGYAGYYGLAVIVSGYTHIDTEKLLVPMFFIVPGVVLSIFGLKNDFKGFFNCGIFLFASGIFFIVWKISLNPIVAVLFAFGISEIIRDYVFKRGKVYSAVGVAFVIISLVLAMSPEIVFAFVVLVLIAIKRKKLK